MTNSQIESESKISVKRLRKRDKKEVAHWFNTYADPVYGFIYYRVGRDADLAGEAAQETFGPHMGHMGIWGRTKQNGQLMRV